MSNNIKWNWNDSQKVGMNDVAVNLSLREGFRYTICPPKVQQYTTKLDLTYRRRCNEQWERLPELRDRDMVHDIIANGFVWDRHKEEFVELDVPYEIADDNGNVRLLSKETGKKIDLWENY
jgi:uncharacterized protein YcfJ